MQNEIVFRSKCSFFKNNMSYYKTLFQTKEKTDLLCPYFSGTNHQYDEKTKRNLNIQYMYHKFQIL